MRIALWAIPASAILPLLGAILAAYMMIAENHRDELPSLPLVFLIYWAICYTVALSIAVLCFAAKRLFSQLQRRG